MDASDQQLLEPKSATVLLIDDDPATIQLLRHTLSEYPDIFFATSGEEGLQLARHIQPDIILLDAEMPGLSGLETCRLLKQEPQLANVPIIFVTGHDNSELELKVLELGAVDFITKPISVALLCARVRTQLKLKFMSDELRLIAGRDGLTGLANRRQLNAQLHSEWRRALRATSPLSALLIDVDYFKRYNDSEGHLAGDDVLRRLAKVFATTARRAGDLAARYGGEEFLLLLPGFDAASARETAELVRVQVEQLQISHPQSDVSDYVTISVGVSVLEYRQAAIDQQTGGEPEWLISNADKALYEAKRSGRNRVAFQASLLPLHPSADE